MIIKHGHLYLADLNPTRGIEPGKLRPVLVIQNDLLNETSHPSTWVIPCTTKLTSENSILRVRLPAKIAGNDKSCEIMIDQNRAIDNRRFRAELGPLPAPLLRETKEKLRLLADL